MKPLASAVIGVTLALLGTTGSLAARPSQRPTHGLQIGTTTFQLAVAGSPVRGATFWVSYGPLAGHFGVIQLHSNGNHLYSARAGLPLKESSTFTFLQAQGIQMVHGLPQPGGIPVVIRRMDAVTAVAVSQRIVHWSVPLG